MTNTYFPDIYLYTLFEAFDPNGSAKTSIAGGSNPLVIIVNEDSKGVYSVVNHKELSDGDSYGSSLKRIFPHKYLIKINQPEISKELNEKMKSILNQVGSNN